jgi:large subunit ribosomal protein L25
MKTSFELVAEFRNDQGKGASRRLRSSGKVPAILYGGHRDARGLAVDHVKLLQLLDNERFYTTILSLKVGELTQAAILKDIQRHPYRNQVLHIDFQRVLEDEKIRLAIPLHFLNEASAPGVKTQGGLVSHLRTDVEVSCLPKDLPEFIEVDCGNLGLNQSLRLSDLKVPEGVELVELAHGRDVSIVSVHAPRAEEEVAVAAPEAAAVPAAVGAPAAAEAGAAAPAKAEPAKKEGGKK